MASGCHQASGHGPQAEQVLTVKEESWLQFLRARKESTLLTGCLSRSWELYTSPLDLCKLRLMCPFWSSALSAE